MLSNFFFKKTKQNLNRNIHYLRKTSNIDKILIPECLDFINDLYNDNIEKYKECVELRKKMNMDKNYDFRKDTSFIRDSEWKVNTLPENLQRRHVEITGPGNNAKMIITKYPINILKRSAVLFISKNFVINFILSLVSKVIYISFQR